MKNKFEQNDSNSIISLNENLLFSKNIAHYIKCDVIITTDVQVGIDWIL